MATIDNEATTLQRMEDAEIQQFSLMNRRNAKLLMAVISMNNIPM
jgi:hypothetical protein